MDLLKDNIPKLVRKLAVPAMVGTFFKHFIMLLILFLQEKYLQKLYQL